MYSWSARVRGRDMIFYSVLIGICINSIKEEYGARGGTQAERGTGRDGNTQDASSWPILLDEPTRTPAQSLFIPSTPTVSQRIRIHGIPPAVRAPSPPLHTGNTAATASTTNLSRRLPNPITRLSGTAPARDTRSRSRSSLTPPMVSDNCSSSND